MSTKTKTSATDADASTSTLPWVRKPGNVPIKSWAVPLEGSALEQATNLSNLPFAIDYVALMPDAHTGYGMPIGGVLFAETAVVPYAIGVDIGCGVALVEHGPDRRDPSARRTRSGARGHRCGGPYGFQKLGAPVDREVAEAAMGLERPESLKSMWLEWALWQAGDAGWWQPLPGAPAR